MMIATLVTTPASIEIRIIYPLTQPDAFFLFPSIREDGVVRKTFYSKRDSIRSDLEQ
jgi:hypothetical protein